MRLYTAFSRA